MVLPNVYSYYVRLNTEQLRVNYEATTVQLRILRKDYGRITDGNYGV